MAGRLPGCERVNITRATTWDDLRMANARVDVRSDYRLALDDAVKADDPDEIARWTRIVKQVRRVEHRLVEPVLPPPSLNLDALDAGDDLPLYDGQGGHDPPRPIDAATTSPHRPCAPPTSLVRGHEWLPRVGTVGTTQKAGGVVRLIA